MVRPEAGPMLAAAGLGIFLTVFTWSCQTISDPGGSPALQLAGEPDINVRVRNGEDKVTLAGPRLVFVTQAGSEAVLLKTPVLVSAEGTGLVLTEAGGRELKYAAGIEVASGAPREPGVPATVAVDGTEYPGRLRIMAAASVGSDTDEARPIQKVSQGPGGVDVIAVMGMETYLPGVVAKELPGGWPDETNRVGAVAARSYALHQRTRARAAGRVYDVESTTRDQAYLGATTRREAVGAVKATAGQVLVYSSARGTELLRAYYSSTCGGRTASAADVWPIGSQTPFNRAGPIQGKIRDWACQGSPVYRWQVERDRGELERRFRAWGVNAGSDLRHIGTLASIQVTRTGATGRPTRYIVSDTSGRRVEMNAEELRVACNTEASGLPAPDRKTLVRSGDLEATVIGGTVTITGRGFGHGVGMCQYCSKGLAEKGMDYRRMLDLFYPGARLEKAY
jgi:stage II sporulation protein D